MEAATQSHAHDHAEVELMPATWRDSKRYAWLLGADRPLAPFIAWGSVEATGWEGFWFFAPLLVFGVFPLLDVVDRHGPSNPPDSILKWLEQDRYYRWCTYVFIPIQYAGAGLRLLALGRAATSPSSRASAWRSRWASSAASGSTPPTSSGHKRAELERWLSRVALAPDRLRPLLHRAQPRPPRPRRHAGGPGQLAAGRELLGLPAAHRRRQPALGLGDRERPPRPHGQAHWTLRNDILSAWAMTVVLFAVLAIVFGPVVLPYLLLQAVLGFSLLEVVNYLEHYGLLRQKREDGRYERCRRRAQLEQQQRRLQRAALPPAAPQRPPRQPDPALPGAAPLRGGAAAADRLRRDDRARLVPADLAPGDGPAPARALRRRRRPAPTSSPASARAASSPATGLRPA